MDSKCDWAEVLRSFRQRNNLKQEAAASLLGVSQAYVSKVENGAVQPSSALLKRLAMLIRQPQHRPTIGLYKTAVRHAPYLACLFSLRDGQVFIEESSREFYRRGHPFDLEPQKGLVNFDMFGEDGVTALKSLVSAGAFDGKFGLIETVWKTAPRDGHPLKHFKTLLVPLRSDQNEWLLQASLTEISAADMAEAIKAWGGPIRIFEHDEEPPFSWP